MASHDQREDSEVFCNVSSIHGFEDIIGKRYANETSWFRYGSTLLISGPPGAGKTTFALATVRAIMRSAFSKDKKTIAYYIGSEATKEQLKTRYRDFRWFSDFEDTTEAEETEETLRRRGAKVSKRAATSRAFYFHTEHREPDMTNFYCITPMLEVDRPVPSSEELVNGIFNRIVDTLQPSESPCDDTKIYIIVDSISALLKGCDRPGEERRQTYELIRRLSDRLGDRLALTVLLAEQQHRMEPIPDGRASSDATEPSAEDYLADTVFRLYIRNLPLGRRSRVLEVVKSQGVNMVLGDHTWAILSQGNWDGFLRAEEFRNEIIGEQCGYFEETPPPTWGAIIIFPRPQLVFKMEPKASPSAITPNARNDQETDAGQNTDNGTKGWERFKIEPRSITLITGPLGCGKTKLCKQFLSAGASASPPGFERVLITLDMPHSPEKERPFSELLFTQSLFDLNILIAHINWLIKKKCKRLAFDGLSEWLTAFDHPEAARILETLMLAVRRHGKNAPSVFMTYEMPLGDDPLSPSAFGAAADNLVVVSLVPINDKLRTVLYVLKYLGGGKLPRGATLDYPGELVPTRGDDESVKIELDTRSLSMYTDLLTNREGGVRPARVLVQTFAENNTETMFNKKVQKELRAQYEGRLDFTFTNFTLGEISSTLETSFKPRRPGEAFSLAIHSVDEWWLQAKDSSKFLKDLKDLEEHPKTEDPKTRKGPNQRDFWWFEVEKATDSKGDWRAVPSFIDFGMFCLNAAALTEEYRDKYLMPVQGAALSPEDKRKGWQRLLHDLPRLWAEDSADATSGWFRIGDKETPSTALGFALKVTGQENTPCLERKPVFTFDTSPRETCACLFFELAWAFGARESFLEKREPPQEKAAKRALQFLQFLVLEGLMPARGAGASANGAEAILLSREWYSTLQKHNEVSQQSNLQKGQQDRGDRHTSLSVNTLLPIPFMPNGITSPGDTIKALLEDICDRQGYWLKRAEKLANSIEHSISESNRDTLKELYGEIVEANDQCRQAAEWTVGLRYALTAYSRTRQWLRTLASLEISAALENVATLDDMLELASWAALRLRLFFGNGSFPEDESEENSSSVGSALLETRKERYALPNLDEFAVGLDDISSEKVVATGYVCSGSWMYGVDKASRPSEVRSQILGALTSLDTARMRAEMGAGMPARKDFFYLHGEQPVPGIEYLNWRELLRFGGSRCRRRDRVFGERNDNPGRSVLKDPAPLYATIQEELLACLGIADLYRSEYACEVAKRNVDVCGVIGPVLARAESAVDRIYMIADETIEATEKESGRIGVH